MRPSRIILDPLLAILVCMLAAVLFSTPVSAAHDARLKPGARGRECLKCHEALQKTLAKRAVHPMLRAQKCTACHDPHTSSHKNLLITDARSLCISCHKEMVPDKPRSAHQVVVEGNCISCHNAHGSDHPNILNTSGNALCVECHKDYDAQAKSVQFKHEPLEKGRGCLSCHNPHASTQADALLKKQVPGLCAACHQTDRPTFTGRHMNFNVANSRCDSCHSPHGSNKRGILYDDVHAPVAEKKCSACHPRPTSARVLQAGQNVTLLCQQCHRDMIAETLNKNRVHWPLLEKVSCLNCHNPHGAREKKLLNDTQFNVCGSCHKDTVQLQQWSIKNPKNENLCEPVRTGDCVSCHSPHAADNVLLMRQENISIDLCGKCHEWESHSTHPIGEKIVDQRNRNLTVECLSCHQGCGTGNRAWMMPFATTYDLCTQCHVERRR